MHTDYLTISAIEGTSRSSRFRPRCTAPVRCRFLVGASGEWAPSRAPYPRRRAHPGASWGYLPSSAWLSRQGRVLCPGQSHSCHRRPSPALRWLHVAPRPSANHPRSGERQAGYHYCTREVPFGADGRTSFRRRRASALHTSVIAEDRSPASR